jgi:hypothetical protein
MLDLINLLTGIMAKLSEDTIAYKILESALWHLVMQGTQFQDTHTKLGTVEMFCRIYAKTRNTLPN